MSNKEYIDEIKKISKNLVDQRVVEIIMINTFLTEEDIYFLAKKFFSSNPNREGMISLEELLEIKEFKFCPFRKFLPYGFDLEHKPDNNMVIIVY